MEYDGLKGTNCQLWLVVLVTMMETYCKENWHSVLYTRSHICKVVDKIYFVTFKNFLVSVFFCHFFTAFCAVKSQIHQHSRYIWLCFKFLNIFIPFCRYLRCLSWIIIMFLYISFLFCFVQQTLIILKHFPNVKS